MIKKKKAEPIKEVKELADLIHSEDETIVVLFYNDSLVLAERLYNEGYCKVVRCKDCKHIIFLDDGSPECTRVYLGTVHKNDYCSYGEREQNER